MKELLNYIPSQNMNLKGLFTELIETPEKLDIFFIELIQESDSLPEKNKKEFIIKLNSIIKNNDLKKHQQIIKVINN